MEIPISVIEFTGIWVSTTSTTGVFFGGGGGRGRGVMGGRYVDRVMDDNDVFGRTGRFVVRRVRLPSRAVDSFTVIGPDRRPVELVDEYLAWLTDCERSPNTVEAYAHDLRAFWTFLGERGLRWDQVDVMELGEFAAWARRPAANVVVLAEEAARLSARTVNRMLSGWSASTSSRPVAARRWRRIWS